MHPGKPHGKKESGSVIVMTAMMATVLFGVMGMAIEVAGFYSLKRKMQTAADAGAKAGAIERWNGTTNWTTEARRGTSQNGYTHGTDGVTVTVNSPPTTRAAAIYQSSRYVEVIVQQPQNLHLMTILSNQRTKTVTAWAVGGPVPTPGASIVVLNPTASDSFLLSGGATVDIPGGVVIDSNNATKALDLTGGSTLTSSQSYINVVGSQLGCGCTASAGLHTNNSSYYLADPLFSIAAPTGYTTTCDAAHTNHSVSGTENLTPGTYCGGIKVQGGATANFAAGTYILLGGGLTVSPGTVNGTGVTFYNTYDGTHAFKELNISGGTSVVTLSAPTTGTLAGMLWFTDRTAPSGTVNTLQGGGALSLNGAIYFKTEKLKWSGGTSNASPWTMIIADRMELSGGLTTIGNTVNSVPVPISKPSLVE